MEPITSQSVLDGILGGGTAILLKHGARCPISAHARDEVSSFAASRPSLSIYSLEVTENPGLSRLVEERLGIRHESPQVLLLREGKAVWHATHYDIDVRSLERHAPADEAPQG